MSPELGFLMKLVEEHAVRLGEHFDSVRIICTIQDDADGETKSISRGSGNFYAQQASVREQVIEWDEYVREHAREEQANQQDEP